MKRRNPDGRTHSDWRFELIHGQKVAEGFDLELWLAQLLVDKYLNNLRSRHAADNAPSE